MLNGAIAIFVKTPGLSPIKTRLAASTGRAYAESWYRLAADAVAEVAVCAARARGAHVYWAVAETQGMDDTHWSSLPRIAQGDGGLGERMARVHTQLVNEHGAAMLIGADVSQVNRDRLVRALSFLDTEQPAAVIGPAEDGGFWLFGANRGVPLSAWTVPEYGTARAHAEFKSAVACSERWLDLEPLTDLDTGDQLEPMRGALAALPVQTPAQAALLRWMDNPTVS